MVRLRRLLAGSLASPLDAVLIAVVVGLVGLTTATVGVPGMPVRIVSPSLDLVLDTLVTAVILGGAALGWVRWRQRGEPVALFQSAAFLALTLANGLLVGLIASGRSWEAGMDPAGPGQAPLYILTGARFLSAVLLVVGGLASLWSMRIRHAGWVVLGAALATLALATLALAGAVQLPSLGSMAESAAVTGGVRRMPAPTPAGAVIQVLVTGLLLWAAGLSRRLWRRDGAIADGYLAIGLVFAAFAQVQSALYPGTYAGIVTTGDVLRLCFALILVLGIQAEASATLASLRRANTELDRLRVVEAEGAALAERTRLSRELHDGLAQDLWLAKLKSARLAALPGLAPEAGALVGELGMAVDASLADAQHAVAALRDSAEPGGALADVIARTVDEFADRCGLRVDLECPAELPRLPARAEAEALRIVQEALNNVRRHADATVVRMRAVVEDGQLVVTVGDNGRGFDPAVAGAASYGLTSMRERAALIGAELRIDSRPRDGTRVSLLLPLALAPAPAVDRAR